MSLMSTLPQAPPTLQKMMSLDQFKNHKLRSLPESTVKHCYLVKVQLWQHMLQKVNVSREEEKLASLLMKLHPLNLLVMLWAVAGNL